jgi:putative phage-type endonuclease
MAISDAVIQERYGYIGSSDAASVCGIPSAFSTPYGVFVEKVWRLRGDVDETMEIGNLMEPVIAELYRRRMKTDVIPFDTVKHATRNWQAANLDGVAIRPDETRRNRVVEMKNAAIARGWGPAGTDMIPSHYYLQSQHQMDVVSSVDVGIDPEVMDVAVLIGGCNFRIYEVQRSPNVIARMAEIEAGFWDQVQRKIAPAPDFTHRATLDLVKMVHQTVDEFQKKQLTDAEQDMVDMIMRCRDLKRASSQAEKAAKELQARILHDMGSYSVYSLPGGTIVRRQKVRTKHGGFVKLSITGGEDDVDTDDAS